MPQNDFLAYANDPAANVTTQTDWEGASTGSGVVAIGVGPGIASSALANKAWRQSSVIASAVAQFIADTLNQDVLDSGGAGAVSGIVTQLTEAVQSAAVGGLSTPTVQRFTGGSGAYAPSAGARYIRVRMIGGGGGGGATITNNGGPGGSTSLGTWTAIGGSGGTASNLGGNGGTGGVSGAGTLIARIAGMDGGICYAAAAGSVLSSPGGVSVFGGAAASVFGPLFGKSAKPNTGSGGGGGAQQGVGVNGGGGGGASEYVEFFMTAAQIGASQPYTVGAAGTGGAAGTQAGGAGGSGVIIIEEYYS